MTPNNDAGDNASAARPYVRSTTISPAARKFAECLARRMCAKFETPLSPEEPSGTPAAKLM
jgi:hypothetical protein